MNKEENAVPLENTEKPVEIEPPIVLKPISPPERSRTYLYAGEDGVADSFTILDVCAIGISKSGGHRLLTKTGKKYIPAPGWLAIELDVDYFQF